MYLWVKAFHIIAAISWMAGLLYLPRLFVYHAGVEPNSPQAETFAIMERRLLKTIMNPAMIVTFGLGLWMIWLNPTLLSQGWFLVKVFLVILLAGCHVKFAAMRRAFEEGTSKHSQGYYRIWNEVPTLLIIGIVILAVIKP